MTVILMIFGALVFALTAMLIHVRVVLLQGRP